MVIYSLISLIGAALLFLVQPMAAKSALPILGGASFVWNGCMVFFQTLLLAGYLYAYVLNRMLPVRWQALIHVPLLALTLLAFPLSFSGSPLISPAQQPICWLLTMLTLSIGAPFFVLSATSPLSQRWFSASGHVSSHNPYVLYAASNIGSFIGLFAYPLLLEPNFSIREQAEILHYGVVILLGLFAVAGFYHLRTAPSAKETIVVENNHPPTVRQVTQWVLLSFVPASLLYGVTSYITTDVASIPLFWIIPLALYLLTFILAFSNRPPSLTNYRTLHLMGAPAMACFALLPLTYPVPILLLHLLIFFSAAIVCHSKLSQIKPHPERLTVFFLWLSFGGVLGGVFNTLLAPMLFNSVIEYPLMLVISLVVTGVLARPALGYAAKVVAIWSIFSCVFWLLGNHITELQTIIPDEKKVHLALRTTLVTMGLILLMTGYFRHKNQPLYYVAWVAPLLLIITPLFVHVIGESQAFIGRNVYGVSRVLFQDDMNAWIFRHGTTYHGIQSVDNTDRLAPVSYYGPLKEIYTVLPKNLTEAPVAVMGMGVGTVACYGHTGQDYDFFEIDPLVDTIAHDTRYFTYLRDCPPTKHVIMGDGRISLSQSADSGYGLIIIDVFTSDAIPMHLMTREAVAMYVQKLHEGGMIAIHVSNRHIDLLPVLAAIAKDAGLSSGWILHVPSADERLAFASKWVVLTKNNAALNNLMASDKDWQPLPEANPHFLWQDSYSNILRSINFE